MNNIKKNLISSAWHDLSKKSSNKFWGLLSILASIDNHKIISPCVSYKINVIQLSKTLERLFYFGDIEKKYSNSNQYVIFSNIWAQKALYNFSNGKISLSNAAIFYFIDKQFDKEIDLNYIVENFKKEIKLNDNDLNILFDTNYINITSITEPSYPKQDIINSIKSNYGITIENKTLTLEDPYSVVSHPSELSRAPFIQTLYAAQSNFECLILTKFDLNKLYKYENNFINIDYRKNKQIIFYGAPGTGKSTKVKKLTAGEDKTVITFHPDTDYSSFVGAYKPIVDGKNILYAFTPQAFSKAYIKAWSNLNNPHFLIIEEINRGNCAQIFGDIFQLLDRREDGFSDYVIDVDKDFADFIEKELSGNEDYKNTIIELCDDNQPFSFSKISLPPNLYIYATMNTSDQSLFPMDSAFKRRWDWEYLPIDIEKANEISISIGDNQYNWGEFLSIINPKIKELTGAEDKQLGNFFVKVPDNIISFEQFRSKVMFYLWFEIFKDEVGTNNTIFKYEDENTDYEFSFGDLFNNDAEEIMIKFMDKLELKYNKKAEEYKFNYLESKAAGSI